MSRIGRSFKRTTMKASELLRISEVFQPGKNVPKILTVDDGLKDYRYLNDDYDWNPFLRGEWAKTKKS
jgi:hypothetical protein